MKKDLKVKSDLFSFIIFSINNKMDMEDNWLNIDPNDGFNPDNHEIEMDEIAKMYALADMKESQEKWAKEKAEVFYKDFENVNIDNSIQAVLSMISKNELNLHDVNLMLDNMINIFQESEEYEKCHVCLQIKKGINAEI